VTNNRSIVIQIIFFVFAIVLIVNAFYLQVLDESIPNRAVSTVTDNIEIYPARGLIYDRNGELMVVNEQVYDIKVTYNFLEPSMDTLRFCEFLGISQAEFEKRMDIDFRNERYSKRIPFIFLSTISSAQITALKESLHEFPGFSIQRRNVRGYPHSSAAHILGYIREVNRAEVDADDNFDKEGSRIYESGDYIGSDGLESTYESYLKGEKGQRVVFKDRLGREVGDYKEGAMNYDPISGADIHTSLDLELQAYAESLMNGKKGAVVAIEPETGEILCMLSSPSYDPGLLTISKERGKNFQQLNKNPNNLFFNRSLSAQYPPGSTHKMLVGLVGMQEGVISHDQYIPCPGYYSYNNFKGKCRNHPPTHNIGRAIQFSCNTYFWHTFQKIIDKGGSSNDEANLDKFYTYMREFGLGQELGVDLPGEEDGKVPNAAFYNKIYGKNKWYSTFIISLGIGQGELLLTTLQMANMSCLLGNRGYYKTPHLVKRFENTSLDFPKDSIAVFQSSIDKQHFEHVVEGMKLVVQAGTGRQAQNNFTPIAGKTGTVQNKFGEDHSTFIGFSPTERPKIAVAVYVENAGGGGTFAAPIAGLIMEKYTNGEISKQKKWVEERMINTILIEETEITDEN
jgi:penicillin-binding protein 2